MKRTAAPLAALVALLLPALALAQLAPPGGFAPYGARDGLYLPAPAAVVADDADAVAWFAAVATNGGTVSTIQRARVNTLVAALKAAGAWAPTDDCWLLVAESAPQALTSLKQRRLAVAVASPAFAVALGYSFDGTASYLDTGFIPSTMGVALTADAVRIAAYIRAVAAPSGAFAAGTRNTGSRQLRIAPLLSAGPAAIDVNSSGATFVLPAPTANGMTTGQRSDATAATTRAYKNGLPMVRLADPTGFGTPPSNALFIGAQNNNGPLGGAIAATIGFVSVGGPLSDAQELSAYGAVQAYMNAWGAGV